MPRNSQGQYTLPNGYLAVTGQTVKASQHNPPLEDLAAAMTNSMPRDGSAPLTGDLNASSYRIRNVKSATAAGDAVNKAQMDAAMPIGAVMDYAGQTAPSGWLMCAGQAVSRVTYSALFAVIGTTYGAGDGSTTFALPDARGRVTAGKDDMNGSAASRLTNKSGGVNGSTLGAAGGAETHTLSQSELPAHAHGAGSLGTTAAGAHGHQVRIAVTDQDSLHSKTTGGLVMATDTVGTYGPNAGGAGDSPGQQIAATGDHAHGVTGSTASTGSGAAHNNVQPTLVLNKIIRSGV